ncbi:MAG: GntR family transcriptional regulator [Actinomycetia bacterium]|nr:GntR family transcriptional regulator [Actinomycetes bacterium]
MDLLLDLSTARGRRRGIETALRDAVRGGRLVPGATLPSTRTLATDLGVARGTVVAAYAQLVGEGYLAPGPDGHVVRSRSITAGRPVPSPVERPLVDLHAGEPDPTSFPMAAWLAALRRAARDAPPDALAYGDQRGALALRVALADYLGRARGVVADPDRIIVCSGAVDGLRLLAEVVGGRIGMEDPGLFVHRRVVAQTGATVVPVPVDDLGADPTGLAARAAVLTPAHQFPLGMALAPERRLAFVDWARRTGGLVIEDDYDGELRYDRQPVGAIQGLDPDAVAYVGTASKSLGPGLRLAWMVLPEHLVRPVVERIGAATTVPTLDQLALAELLTSHQYERHLRRRRLANRDRRDQLLAALGPDVEVRGLAAGLSALVVLPTAEHEARATALAVERRVRLFGLGPNWHGDRRLHGLLVGYGRPPAHDLRRSIEVFTELLGDVLDG